VKTEGRIHFCVRQDNSGGYRAATSDSGNGPESFRLLLFPVFQGTLRAPFPRKLVINCRATTHFAHVTRGLVDGNDKILFLEGNLLKQAETLREPLSYLFTG
jgi:hypothetical protein